MSQWTNTTTVPKKRICLEEKHILLTGNVAGMLAGTLWYTLAGTLWGTLWGNIPSLSLSLSLLLQQQTAEESKNLNSKTSWHSGTPYRKSRPAASQPPSARRHSGSDSKIATGGLRCPTPWLPSNGANFAEATARTNGSHRLTGFSGQTALPDSLKASTSDYAISTPVETLPPPGGSPT